MEEPPSHLLWAQLHSADTVKQPRKRDVAAVSSLVVAQYHFLHSIHPPHPPHTLSSPSKLHRFGAVRGGGRPAITDKHHLVASKSFTASKSSTALPDSVPRRPLGRLCVPAGCHQCAMPALPPRC